MREQPIHVGAGVCGMLRPGAVLVRCRDTDPRGAPLRRGQDLAGRQVHDPVRSPQGAGVCVQVRSGALRHAGLPLRADPVPGGPSVTPPRIDPRLQGAAVVPPHLIRVYGGIRDRRVPRVGRARLAHLPQPGSAHVDPVPPRASVGVQTTDGRGCPCIGHDPQRLVVCASSLVRAADRGRWHPGQAGAGRGGVFRLGGGGRLVRLIVRRRVHDCRQRLQAEGRIMRVRIQPIGNVVAASISSARRRPAAARPRTPACQPRRWRSRRGCVPARRRSHVPTRHGRASIACPRTSSRATTPSTAGRRPEETRSRRDPCLRSTDTARRCRRPRASWWAGTRRDGRPRPSLLPCRGSCVARPPVARSRPARLATARGFVEYSRCSACARRRRVGGDTLNGYPVTLVPGACVRASGGTVLGAAPGAGS